MNRWQKFWAAVERAIYGFNSQDAAEQAWREREAIVACNDRMRRLTAIYTRLDELGPEIKRLQANRKKHSHLAIERTALKHEQMRLEGMGN